MSPDRDPEDLEDDASLKAMRSVWLEMRDEEPGTGGLSALMAAAHAKAAELRPPTLWQRIGAMLRRPPALAFATVLVLVGGAVVVSQEAKDAPPAMESMPRQAPAPAPTMPSAAQGEGRQEEAAPAAPMPAPDMDAVPAAPPAAMEKAAPAKHKKPSAPAPQAARKADVSGALSGATDDLDSSDARGAYSNAAGSAVGGGGGGVGGAGGVGGGGGGGGGKAAGPAGASQGAASASQGAASAPSTVAPALAPSASAPAPKAEPKPTMRHAASESSDDEAVSAFERKAIAAAEAGDCGTAAKLLAQIGQRDPDARARLAQRPAIQGCVTRTKSPAPLPADANER